MKSYVFLSFHRSRAFCILALTEQLKSIDNARPDFVKIFFHALSMLFWSSIGQFLHVAKLLVLAGLLSFVFQTKAKDNLSEVAVDMMKDVSTAVEFVEVVGSIKRSSAAAAACRFISATRAMHAKNGDAEDMVLIISFERLMNRQRTNVYLFVHMKKP